MDRITIMPYEYEAKTEMFLPLICDLGFYGFIHVILECRAINHHPSNCLFILQLALSDLLVNHPEAAKRLNPGKL